MGKKKRKKKYDDSLEWSMHMYSGMPREWYHLSPEEIIMRREEWDEKYQDMVDDFEAVERARHAMG